MKSIKTNKIISFMLAVVMILSTISPAYVNAASNTYFSDVSEGDCENSVTYIDSGKIVENPETGTDLDNFKIDLNFGTIDSAIKGDTVNILNKSVQIPVVINVKYIGNTPYNAGDITLNFQHNLDGMVRNPNAFGYTNNHNVLGDVGAELKGSGSGRGDWYYIVNKNADLNSLTFTNKSDTAGAFTSSIEVIFTMPSNRHTVNGFSGNVDLNLSVKGLEGSLKSKTLTVKTNTTHDEYSLDSIKPEQVKYTSYGTEDNIGNFQGVASLNDYYIMKLYLNSSALDINRGSYYHSKVNLPEGVKFVSGMPIEFNDIYEEWLDDYYKHEMYIAISKDKYQAGDIINIEWTADATFFDTNEKWNQTISQEIEVKENIITYKQGIAEVEKGNIKLHQYKVNSADGKDFEWAIYPSLNSAAKANLDVDTFMPTKLTIVDDTYRISVPSNSNYRSFTADEYYLNYISIQEIYQNRKFLYGSDNIVKFKVYAKAQNDSDWTFIKEVNSEEVRTGIKDTTYYTYKIPVDKDHGYQFFKIEVDGRTVDQRGTYVEHVYRYIGGYHIQVDPETEPYLNSEKYTLKVHNTVNLKEELVNGLVLNASKTGELTFIDITGYPDVTVNTTTYQLKNNRIYYRLDGYFNHNIKPDREDISLFTNDHFTCEYKIPAYFEYDIQDLTDVRFNFYNGNVVNKTTKEVIDWSTANKNLNKYIDYENSTFKITTAGKYKTLSLDIKLKDNYTYYSNYPTAVNFKADVNIYMDLDTYSGLLYLGKLPSSVNVFAYNYKFTEGYFKSVRYTKEYASHYSTLKLPSLAGSTFEGVEKFVNTVNGYVKDLQAVKNGHDYSYKLRVAGGQTKLQNIVIYDNLEMAYGENEHWQGTFNGIDTSLLDMYFAGEEYAYTVYYSENNKQEFNLTSDGWIKAEDWTKELADVKSIAVDLGEFALPTKSIVYVVVNMIAPENSKAGVRAYNSFAADYKAYDVNTNALMEDVKALPTNTVEVIINKPINYTVNKVWQGGMDSAVSVELLANGETYETITLNTENSWTHTFNKLPAVDEDYNPITYAVKEITVDGYTVKYNTTTDVNGNITTTITNTKIPEYTYSFEKVWDVKDPDLVLEYNDNFGITKELFTEIMTSTDAFVNAFKGEAVEVFKATVGEGGNIVVPSDYKDCDKFIIVIEYKNTTYEFTYNVEKVSPVIPESITLTSSEGDVITLTKENNWKDALVSRTKDLTFTESNIEGWTLKGIDVEANAENSLLYSVIATNSASIKYNVNSSLNISEYTYNFEKEWDIKEPFLEFGYDSSFDLTKDEYIDMIESIETCYITATGEGLEEVSFKLHSDENSNIVILSEYKDYSVFKFAVTYNNKIYEFTYNVEKVTPTIPDSITLTSSEGDVITLTKENNWKDTLTSIKSELTFTENSVEGFDSNITITKLGDYEYDVKVVNTGKVSYNVSASCNLKEFEYSFEKKWDILDIGFNLGYDGNTGLTKDEFINLLEGKTLNITASGEGLTETTFESTADENGIIEIPVEYKAYTDFYFEVVEDNVTYQFAYTVSKHEPVIPDNITLKLSNGEEVVLTKGNNWKTTVKFTDKVLTCEEVAVDGWTLKGISDNDPYSITITNEAYVTYSISGKMTEKEYNYTFEKLWTVTTPDLTLGYIDGCGIDEDTYKAIMSDGFFYVKLTGEGLEPVTLEIATDENGNFVIPAEYTNYTTVEFTHIYEDMYFNFKYNISKSDPTIPTEIILTSSEGDVITIKASEDWIAELVSIHPDLTFTEADIEGWKLEGIEITEGSNITTYEDIPSIEVNPEEPWTPNNPEITNPVKNDNKLVVITNTADIIFNTDLTVTKYEFEYVFNKEWIVEHKDVVLGYNAASGLTEEAYKEIVGGKTLNIVATYKNHESEIFEVVADENGNFVIPAQYATKSNFKFTITHENITYTFDYSLSYANPEIPESITLTSSKGEVVVLKAEDNWTTTFVSNYSDLTFTETVSGNWNSEVEIKQIESFKYAIEVENTDNYTYTSDVVVVIKDYEFNFEKDWVAENDSFVLGYDKEFPISEAEYVELMAGKTLKVNYYGKEKGAFEVTYDMNGNFVVPVEYSNAAMFEVTFDKDEKNYTFLYEVEKVNPVIPEEITLKVSNGDTVVLSKENDWKATYKFNDPTVVFEEVAVEGFSGVIAIKLDGDKFAVEVLNTGKYSYKASGSLEIKEKYEEITVTKTWRINEDYLKIKLKDRNGNKVDFTKIEILTEDGLLLETILKTDADIVKTASKYSTDATYIAKVYLANGREKSFNLNENKFVVTSIEAEVFADGVSYGVYTLTAENGWKTLAKVPVGSKVEIVEVTQGEWVSEYTGTGLINNVKYEIEITDIVITELEIIDTGDDTNFGAYGVLFLGSAVGLAVLLLLTGKKKKKEDK